MERDNRGLSMVEIIIILALIAVLAGAVGLGIGMVSGRAADECAGKLRSAIRNSRITTMGKGAGEVRLYIYEAADGRFMIRQVIGAAEPQTTPIGDKGVTVEFKITGDTTYRPLGDESHPLIIGFDRSSGAFKMLDAMGGDYIGKYCVEIKVSKGDRTKTLELFSLTGKVTME